MYKARLTEAYFPAVRSEPIDEVSIGAELAKAAQDSPERVALKEMTSSGAIAQAWTYEALYRDARLLATALAARHEAGTRIAIWAPNSPQWVILEYAAALAGLTVVTVNPSFQARELNFVLRQSRASALYLVQAHRGNPMGQIAAEVCAQIPQVTSITDLTDQKAMMDGADPARSLPLVKPDDPAQIQYTSGTTGFPKGALLHHKGLFGNAKRCVARTGPRDGDVWLNFMPLFHTGGCGMMTLGPLSARACVIIAPMFDPMPLNAVIEKERVTGFLAVPTMITGLLAANDALPRDLSTVRTILAGGALVPPELVKRARAVMGADIQICFGQTEASPVVTQVWPDDALNDVTESCGQAIPDVEVSIRDLSSNAVVPIGAQGEICARSFMNMLRYNDNPDATASALDKEGWLHTGDLGTMDERGYVRVTGRVKDMIIRGGENLFPAEIENAMLEHPLMREVAVVGASDPKFGEIVVCFMRLHETHQRPNKGELVSFCRARLSPQKTPAHWVYIEEWPLTASGKIKKYVLREMFDRGEFADRIIDI